MTAPARFRQEDLTRAVRGVEKAGVRARWPRLLNEREAAAYLSIGTTTLREKGPEAKALGRRRLYDIKDLDRWADRLGGQPLDNQDADAEAAAIERRFLEKRRARG